MCFGSVCPSYPQRLIFIIISYYVSFLLLFLMCFLFIWHIFYLDLVIICLLLKIIDWGEMSRQCEVGFGVQGMIYCYTKTKSADMHHICELRRASGPPVPSGKVKELTPYKLIGIRKSLNLQNEWRKSENYVDSVTKICDLNNKVLDERDISILVIFSNIPFS